MPPSECSRQVAERALAAARDAGDHRGEALALADLGLMHLYEGDAPQGLTLLEDALALTRQFGDSSWEADTRGHLGMAAAAAGHTERGLALLEEQLRSAPAAGNRLTEKTALAHLALTHSRLRDPARALPLFTEAVARAREVGDWQHEAELLWYLAIQHAALRQRDEAIAHAEATVALFEQRGKPQAAWFARHLRAYQAGASDVRPGVTGGGVPAALPEPLPGCVFVPGGWETQLATPAAFPPQAVNGPRLLDMALSATAAMMKFLGSGLMATPPEAREQRLQTCASCEYHTGLRCRVCGCFTTLKAGMANEECPLGQWPA